MLKDYLGQPTVVLGIGQLYPVKILEYEELSGLTQKYILFSKHFIEVMNETDIEETQYELLVTNIMRCEMIYEMMNDENITEEDFIKAEGLLGEDGTQMSFGEFCRLLKIVCKQEFEFNKDEFSFVAKDGSYLNEDNFDLFRETVLRQNMMYEPLYSEDFITQNIIEKTRELNALDKSKDDSDIESIIQLITLRKGLNPIEISNYTYYQVMADYMRIQIDENYQFMKLAMTSGNVSGKPKIPNSAKKVDLDVHPEERMIIKGDAYDSKVDGALS